MSDEGTPLFERLRLAAAANKLDDPNRTPRLMTIGTVRRTDSGESVADAVEKLRQSYAILSGSSALSLLDKALTPRDLIQAGLLTLDAGNFRVGTGTGLMAGANGPTFNGDVNGMTPGEFVGLPYLPVPPTPTNLKASGTYKAVILDWDLLDYANHGHTEVWRSGVNNLGTAVLTGTTASKIYVDTAGVTLGVTYYYWVRDVSNDTTPVYGAYNAGVGGGTAGGAGLIGNVDLGPLIIEAANLASGAVDYTKLSLAIGGGNLLRNSSFEANDVTPLPANGWGGYNNSPGTEPSVITRVAGRRYGTAVRHAWTGANTTTKGFVADNAAGGGVIGGWQIGRRYVLSWWARADTAKTQGMTTAWNTAPATSVTVASPNLATTWQRYIFNIVWGGSVEANGRAYITIAGAETGWVEIDDVQVEEGDVVTAYAPTPDEILPGTITTVEIANDAITAPKILAGSVIAGKIAANAISAVEIQANAIIAGKIAANAIAIGSAAIENGAIRNALIENLAVDTAKIADLAVSTAKMDNLAVTDAKIANAAIISAKIGLLQVLTAHIADANITTAKIGDAQITTAKIVDANITTAKIADASITSAKIVSLVAGKVTVTSGLSDISPNVGLLRIASTGERVEIEPNRISVYDAANVLRVKIGDTT